MAVVGWWTGYKLGGVVALFTAFIITAVMVDTVSYISIYN